MIDKNNINMQTTSQFIRKYTWPLFIIAFFSYALIFGLGIWYYFSYGKIYHIFCDFFECLYIGITFILLLYVSVKLIINDIIKKIVVNKGVFYDANIMGINSFPSYVKGKDVHFIIEFFDNGKKSLFYTQGYNIDPQKTLINNKCKVFKYKNRYFDDGYNIKKKSVDKDENISFLKFEDFSSRYKRKKMDFVN